MLKLALWGSGALEGSLKGRVGIWQVTLLDDSCLGIVRLLVSISSTGIKGVFRFKRGGGPRLSSPLELGFKDLMNKLICCHTIQMGAMANK